MITVIYGIIVFYILLSLVVLGLVFSYKSRAQKEVDRLEEKAVKWARVVEAGPLLREQQQLLEDSKELTSLARVLNEGWVSDESIEQFVIANHLFWLKLGEHYARRSLTSRAYYAWFCKGLASLDAGLDADLAKMMLEFMLYPSVYCRENALKTLYAIGDSQYVLKAYLLLSKEDRPHHSKLIDDGLRSYRGDKKVLADVLYKHIQMLDTNYIIGVVDFFQEAGEHLKHELIEPLKNPFTNKEVTCALLRYYKKHPVQEYKPIILSKLAPRYRYEWEVLAVCVSTLAKYPGDATVEALKQALHSTNWFIRKNAAISLGQLGIDVARISDVIIGENSEAIDQLTYYLASKEHV